MSNGKVRKEYVDGRKQATIMPDINTWMAMQEQGPSLGERFVEKYPPQRIDDDPELMATQKRNLSSVLDFLTWSNKDEMEEELLWTAALGAGAKGVKGGVKAAKRYFANIPMKARKGAPTPKFSDKYKAMMHDKPFDFRPSDIYSIFSKRRSMNMPTAPEGVSDMQRRLYDRYMGNIMEWTSRKGNSFATFKKLPPDLQQDIAGMDWGRVAAGGSRTFPQGFTGYRSSFKPGWAPSGTKVETGEYFAQPEFRNVFEKMLSRNPLRWSGERSFLKETPKSFDRPLEFLNTGKALKLRKVLDTGKLTPDELRRAQIDFYKAPRERFKNKDFARGISKDEMERVVKVFKGKKNPDKYYMMEEAAASEKQMDWGRRVQEMIDDLHKQYDRTGRPLTKKQKMGNY